MSTSLRYYLGALTALFLALTSISCSGDNQTRYVVVRLADSEQYSILDLETGKLLYKNHFNEPPSIIVNDMFCVQNEDGLFDYYSISDIEHPINSESYLNATQFSEAGHALAVKPGEGISIIDDNCKIITTLDDDIVNAWFFRNGYSIIIDKNGKAGFIDESGHIVLRPQYDNISAFSADGTAFARIGVSRDDSKYFVIDTNGDEIFSFSSLDYVKFDEFFNGYCSVQNNEHEVFLLDKTGQEVISLGEFGAYDFSRVNVGPINDIAVFCEDGFYGLKNIRGKIVVPAVYESVSAMTNINPCHYFMARKNDKYGVIDSDNNVIVPFEYENNILGINDHVFADEANGLVTFRDTDGNIIGSNHFKKVFLNNLFIVKSDR